MTNFEKIIISAICLLFVVIIIFGVSVLRQQKDISYIKSVLSMKNASQNKTGKVSTKSVAENYKSLQYLAKQFSGTVESISGSQLTVNAKLPDFSKPKNLDKFKNPGKPVNFKDDDFEALEKKITVDTNEKTAFVGKKLSDLKVGDTVFVDSEKSPYMADSVTATKVTSVAPK